MKNKQTTNREYVANTWNELLALVKGLRGELPNRQVWFRGQSNAAYALLPGLYRNTTIVTKELWLFQKFRQLSLRVFPRRTEDWEALFDMQHYGLPTRLLDWSENLGISAFFAARYNRNASQAAIYILDPLALNEYSGINKIPFVPDDKDIDYRSIFLEKRPFAPKYPIAIEPVFANDRMLAQRGMFTVHGDDITPIERLCPKAVKRIVLAQSAIPEVLDFLETANINEYTVYPDMLGIADYLRRTLL